MKYRFYLTSDGFGSDCTGTNNYGNGKQVYPDWTDDTSFSWEKASRNVFYRLKLDELKFRNKCDNDIYTYDCLNDLALNENVDLYVEKEISGDYELIYHGRFSRKDCDYDEDIETVTIKTEPIDNYEGYMANGDVQYNIIRIPRTIQVNRAGAVERYKHNIFVRDAIRYILDHMNSGLNYSSTFFDGATNPVTSVNPNPLNHLVINHKSNIIAETDDGSHPGTYTAAKIGNISLNELLNILKEIYDIRWDISGTTLRVEHVSFYEESLGDLDLTAEKNNFSHKEYSWHTNKYDYVELPDREEFIYGEKGTTYFQDYFYDSSMDGDDVFIPEEKKITTHTPKNCTCDIKGIHDKSSAFSTDGWVIMQIYDSGGTWYVHNSNTYLDWDSLTSLYWKHQRPFKYAIYGEINQKSSLWDIRTMETKQKSKIQSNLIMDGCDTVWGDTFDPVELVKTEIGNGKIRNMSYNLSSGKLQLSLLQDTEDNKIPPMPFYLEDEMITLMSYMVVTPDWEHKLYMNTLIKKLKDDGVWDKLDWLEVYAMHTNDASEALINWVNPSDTKASLINTPTFTAWRGFTTNGTSSCIDTSQRTVAGGNATTDDCTIGFYTRTTDNTPASLYVDMGCYDGSNYAEIGHEGPTAKTYLALNGPVYSHLDTEVRGMKTLVRTNSTTMHYYENGVEKPGWGTIANSATGSPSINIYIGARHNPGATTNFAAKQYSMAFGAAALSSAEQSDMFDAFEAFMDSLGSGVA